MTDPFESYKLYNALRLHFETDYDAVKYNYKSNVSPKSFFKRKDKYFFAKVAKNYGNDLMSYYLANFTQGVSYIGDMVNEVGDDNYNKYIKVKESIHRVFSVDINKITESEIDFDKCFISYDGQLPFVIQLMMQEDISLETVVILDSLLGFIQIESKKISDTIIWPDIKRRIEKYKPFVNFDSIKCKNLLIKGFTNNA
tara:strand:- start:357 stop:950 length:594 start_codon:yes stop_codon:yes gene_type:complete